MKFADSIAASRYVLLDVAAANRAETLVAVIRCIGHIREDYRAHTRKRLFDRVRCTELTTNFKKEKEKDEPRGQTVKGCVARVSTLGN